MWAAGVGLQNLTPFITERYESLARVNQVTPMYFARILRAVQLGAHDYLQNVAINVVDSVEGVDVPSFAGMLQDLKRGTFHISTNWVPIPEEYLEPPISWSVPDLWPPDNACTFRVPWRTLPTSCLRAYAPCRNCSRC